MVSDSYCILEKHHHSLQSLFKEGVVESDHHTYSCDVPQHITNSLMVSVLDVCLSMQSITSHGQIATRFWQNTSEKHYSHNNRRERSLCGVVLTKLTRPFTAFDTGLAASHNGRHINLQMSSGKLKCQRFSQQHQGPARGIIDWFTFCLEPNIHPGGQKKEVKQEMKEHLLQPVCADAIHLCSFKKYLSPIF